MAEKKTTTTKKTSTAKKPATKSSAKTSANTTAKKTAASKASETQDRKSSNQLTAVILFALAILIVAFIVFPGENVWKFFHNVLCGIFGVWAISLPILMIYVAINMAREKIQGRLSFKIILSSVIIVLICSTVYLFQTPEMVEGMKFFEFIKIAYTDGIENFGSGVIGALIGAPLALAFGLVGARITVILLLFVAVMILTGATLIQLYKTVTKPAVAISHGIKNVKEKKEEERRIEEQNRIDIALNGEPLPMHPVMSPSPEKEEVKKSKPLDKLNKVFGISQKEEVLEKKPITVIKVAPRPTETQEVIENKILEHEVIENKIPENRPVEMPKNETKNEIRTPVVPITSDVVTPVDTPFAVLENATKAAEEFMKRKEEAEKQEIANVAQMALYDEHKDREKTYCFPPLYLLSTSQKVNADIETQELQTNGKKLVETLQSFGVQTKIIDICRGPSVTRYELQPAPGVKISKITNLSDDLALNLAAVGVRIEAPIPGKAAVGIEIPNKNKSVVRMRELLESNSFAAAKSKLTVVLGRDIAGQVKVADLAKMPHMLIAGTTGSGKSVCINSLIVSLMYKSSPDEVRFLMIDPKVVELGVYNGIPHLLVPVVTDPRKAAGALNWAVTEMLNRYKIFAEFNVKDLQGYNTLAHTNNYLDENGQPMLKMPQIVIVIDELADLMMAAPNEVEDSICRLAQMARAAGMHLVVATQRPTVDVVTGLIKANIPSRIAFAVSSTIDSRTILDSTGAEKLLGQGDMLFSPVGAHKPTRIQGCFVQESEIDKIVEFVKKSRTIEYDEKIIEDIEKNAVMEQSKGDKGDKSELGTDPVMEEAIKCVIEAGQASTSLLQRRLRVGYARAGRLIDDMEQLGFVGPHEGSKPRQVLMTYSQWLERNMQKPDEIKKETETNS